MKNAIPIFFHKTSKVYNTSDEEVEEDDEDQNGVNLRVMKQKGVKVKSHPKATM